MARRQRLDRVFVRVPAEAAIELAADPSRFPEFNPLVEVRDGGRVDIVGNVYQQVMRLGPIRVSTRWETTAVDPPNLSERPRPTPPWTTVEVGDLPAFGRWVSTSRYEAFRGRHPRDASPGLRRSGWTARGRRGHRAHAAAHGGRHWPARSPAPTLDRIGRIRTP